MTIPEMMDIPQCKESLREILNFRFKQINHPGLKLGNDLLVQLFLKRLFQQCFLNRSFQVHRALEGAEKMSG